MKADPLQIATQWAIARGLFVVAITESLASRGHRDWLGFGEDAAELVRIADHEIDYAIGRSLSTADLKGLCTLLGCVDAVARYRALVDHGLERRFHAIRGTPAWSEFRRRSLALLAAWEAPVGSPAPPAPSVPPPASERQSAAPVSVPVARVRLVSRMARRKAEGGQ